MTLKQLLSKASIQIPYFIGESLLNSSVASVFDHSRRAVPNSLFVAVKGYSTDGHNFLHDVQRKGALAAIVERPVASSLPQIVVPNTRIALASLCAEIHGNPAQKLNIFGITGTNGKTTTTQMVHHILSSSYRVGLIGGVNIKLGTSGRSSTITTPEPPELHSIFAEMLQERMDHVCMEVSSHALEFHRVHDVPFSIVALTNITADHLDLHHSLESYAKTKRRIFDHLRTDGIALINYDDPLVRSISSIPGHPIISFGQSPEADIRFRVLGEDRYRITFREGIQEYFPSKLGPANVELSVPGLHNMYNSILATGIALLSGCSLPTICAKLADFPGVHRRLELLYDRELKVVDDYAHNPSGIASTVEAVLNMQAKRLIVVYALRGNRGELINFQNGQTIRTCLEQATLPTVLITTNYAEESDPANKVSAAEERAFYQSLATYGGHHKHEPLLRDAVGLALQSAREGDIVLLLGAQGMEFGRTLIFEHLQVEV